MLYFVMQTEGTVLSKSVRQRSLKKTDLSTSASVSADDGQTSLEPGRASKNALSGIVSDSGWY